MGTKLEGDRCYDGAMPNEPMFVLLARDESAPKLVRQWAAIRQSLISAGLKPETDLAQVNEAFALADRMEAWRRDADEAWRKQAAFDFAEGTQEAFRDALVHGVGVTHTGLDEFGERPIDRTIPLGTIFVQPDLMHEHGNVERHLLQHQGDEFFCPRCAKRWGVDEPAPSCK